MRTVRLKLMFDGLVMVFNTWSDENGYDGLN